jgi:hypothetical protein
MYALVQALVEEVYNLRLRIVEIDGIAGKVRIASPAYQLAFRIPECPGYLAVILTPEEYGTRVKFEISRNLKTLLKRTPWIGRDTIAQATRMPWFPKPRLAPVTSTSRIPTQYLPGPAETQHRNNVDGSRHLMSR